MNGYFYTEEQNRWLNANACEYRRRNNELAEAFNSTFGTHRTTKAIMEHLCFIGIRTTMYTEEQKQWLREHFYVPRKRLTVLFNKKFGEERSYCSIKSKMVYLGASSLQRPKEEI